MRITALGVLSLLVLPTVGNAQAQADSVEYASSLLPADVVAARVRAVLYSGGDRESLQALADVIPETAIVGQADIESSFDAALVAEQLATAPPFAVRTADDTGTAGEAVATTGDTGTAGAAGMTGRLPTRAQILERVRAVNVETVFRIVAAVIALLVLTTLLRGRGVRKTSPRGRAVRRGGRRLLVGEARSLVAEGVPLSEVTRRTGLARDALTLLAHQGRS